MKGSRGYCAAIALVLAFVTVLPVFAGGGREREQVPYIAVVSKGEQHDFWQQVRLGAATAAEELGVEMTFEGPPSESDVQIQVEMLNSAIARGPVAIALAALDTASVLDQLESLGAQNIPVIGFDSGVPEAPAGVIYANASTDNFAAAGLAAEKMYEALADEIAAATAARPVRIVVLNQDARGESLLSRGRGFRDTLVDVVASRSPLAKSDIRVTGNPAFVDSHNPTTGEKLIIEMVVPASGSAQDTTSAAQAVLNRVSDQNIRGIFMSNEGTVRGLLSATDDGADLPVVYPGLIAIGFDAGRAQKDAVANRFFLGSVTQDPFSIGYQAVTLAHAAYKGMSVSDVDTGARFYTHENMNDADIKGLLYD
ncbi:ABC transporter substrate-binding protein [Alkalispirochaeta alkalica]|uniref:ABC transporter substrate-binding protein n=1 Tax=Alkalispirochaeta alkalica TaxID=46356 RepID=UPI00036C09C9|nr:ABC transporter substrate-binding protein [Alkalispirochaeta alkalica]